MNITELDIIRFSASLLFCYYYYRSKVYLFLWLAILNLIVLTSNRLVNEMWRLKLIISVYVVLVLFLYLYKNRGLLLRNIKDENKFKLDMNHIYYKKMVLPFLIWLFFAIAVKLVYKVILQY